MARKRKVGVKRTPSGRISEAKSSLNENAEAIALRMRVFGLTEADARDQKAATYIGRLCLAGRRNNADSITDGQYEAAQAYLAAYEAFQRAVKSPDALRTDNGGGDQRESEDYTHWCRAAIKRWRDLRKAVASEQGYHRHANMWAALDLIVCRDVQLPHMIGDLRLALNAVGHHFGMIRRPKRKVVEKDKAA